VKGKELREEIPELKKVAKDKKQRGTYYLTQHGRPVEKKGRKETRRGGKGLGFRSLSPKVTLSLGNGRQKQPGRKRKRTHRNKALAQSSVSKIEHDTLQRCTEPQALGENESKQDGGPKQIIAAKMRECSLGGRIELT